MLKLWEVAVAEEDVVVAVRQYGLPTGLSRFIFRSVNEAMPVPANAFCVFVPDKASVWVVHPSAMVIGAVELVRGFPFESRICTLIGLLKPVLPATLLRVVLT
jgi:hypothetical protein